MTEARRPPFWLPPISLVVIALIVGLVSLSPWAFLPLSVAGQAILLIVLLRAFCYWPPMVRFVRGMPIPHRAIFGLLIASMLLGHYLLNNRNTYPFITWAIFPSVSVHDPVTCREFIATTASGKKVRLLVEQLFPSIVQTQPLDSAYYFPPETTDHLALVLTHAYNERHADDPVHQVDLVVMAIQLHPPTTESRPQPSCQLLKRYDFSSGR